jgi:hypothetical protein
MELVRLLLLLAVVVLKDITEFDIIDIDMDSSPKPPAAPPAPPPDPVAPAPRESSKGVTSRRK